MPSLIRLSTTRRNFLGKTSQLFALMVPGLHTKRAIASDANSYPAVRPGTPLSFPQDHGAHPEYRTEWWYLTASLESELGPLGLQVTFFRSRTPYGRDNPSRFAPQQLVLAHAALAIPEQNKLIHDQQSFRKDDSVAQFSTTDTDLVIGLPKNRWGMARTATDQYLINVNAEAFQFAITATPPSTMRAPVLQGENGFSQKGPEKIQSSYYYSRPQLNVEGQYQSDDKIVPVSGTGWLDHEWSSELLAENATGWDWVGLNFHDGSALMAFQMRTAKGDALYTASRYVTVIDAQRQEHNNLVSFSPLRYWQSPRTDARYPVSMRLKTGALDIILEPLFDDQELDSRGSTGVIYWEGAVQVWHSSDVAQDGTKKAESIATGYLELTGYAHELSL